MRAVNPARKIGGPLPAVLLAVVMSSCSINQAFIPGPLNRDQPSHENTAQTPSAAPDARGTQVTSIPAPRSMKLSSGKPETAVPVPAPSGNPEDANITLSFDQLPLPTFIQTVYGTILKKNFTVDPTVAARTDLVTLRTGRPQTRAEVESTARMLLKSYGIAVLDLGGFLKISPDNNIQGYAPEIRRGRALPETPQPLRPIFYLVEMKAVKASDVQGWIKTMFGTKLSTLTEDGTRNAIMIGGLSDDVYAAMEAIDVLDQPFLRSMHGVRFNPVFWGAEDFARKLSEVLTAQGYSTTTSAGLGSSTSGSITVLPVQPINAVLIFAADDGMVNYVLDWAQELDKPNPKRGATTTYFVYRVRYTDANELAKTLSALLGSTTGSASQLPPPVLTAAERITQERQAAAAPGKEGATVKNSKIVVSVATNSIIFQGTGEEYVQVQNLLKDLDRPSKTVLIEVTVAEVSLTNNENLGIEWALATQVNSHGTITGGTLGGLGNGTAGLLIQQLTNAGAVRATLNALASANRAKILSAPRIVARSGETATIQVGQQVPIITSTQSGLTTGTGVLQSVQYLPTGVILKVKPIVYSGDRIDVEVSQEVSSAESTTTGVSASPTIDTRKVETKLAMRDGATVLLGGLMSSTTTYNNTGVPLLKDIPLVGQLFRVDANTFLKTELIVLITPYVIGDDIDAQSITAAFRRQLGDWAQPQGAIKPKATLPTGSWLDLIRLPSQNEFPHSDVPLQPPIPHDGRPPEPADTTPDQTPRDK
jgi:general secretion pathway protein D